MNCDRYRSLRMLAGVAMLARFGVCSPATAEIPQTTNIVVKNFMFMPMSLTVTTGSTVTWSNQDQEPHTVVSDTGLFRSSAIDTNESFSFKFDQPGTYHFMCSIHPQMVGTIVVQ